MNIDSGMLLSMEKYVGKFRMNEAGKVRGEMNRVFQCKSVGMDAKLILCEEVTSTALYGAETWNAGAAARRRFDVFEVRRLRRMCGVTRINCVRNKKCKGELGKKVG